MIPVEAVILVLIGVCAAYLAGKFWEAMKQQGKLLVEIQGLRTELATSMTEKKSLREELEVVREALTRCEQEHK